ncbi:hypothetical protein G5714_004407 [Onychostoma macrolepis]|uniref:non-specific serine/threonine protein kinase n=1 Tax=Onychostoma macrolepis TaxID=369639 RepID=A0A7J6D5F5_9TELE|nr:hypothetical protein G5714_004407 [Onychostoma macrolepis]
MWSLQSLSITKTQLILIRARPAPNQRLSRIKHILSHPQPQVHPASVRQTVTQIQLILSQLKKNKPKVKKKNGFCSFFRRTWWTVKCATKQHNNLAPLPPQDDTDSADPQPGPSGPDPAALQDPTDLQLDPSIRTVSFPGLSTLPFSELYVAEEEVGRGFFGRVCEGIRKSDGQHVAIKFTTKRETDRYITFPGVSEPLFAEVALNLLLNRAPLSPYRFILVLEYSQPSKDLFKSVFREAPSESQARDLMYQAVLGAKHCLDRGIFHRDIKLDNYVINTTTKQVKLIDFGCGEFVKRGGHKGVFIGYACPPEYFVDFEYEAEPTTVWSLCIMMYRTVCGRQPLTDEHGGLSFHSRVSTALL